MYYLSSVWWFILWTLLALDGPAVDCQSIMSYGMRRLATSLNQFGLDLARSMHDNTNNSSSSNQNSSYSFCPFCVGTSLAILMAGLEENAAHTVQQQQQTDEMFRASVDQQPNRLQLYESLRYGLYLNSMQPQEIHLAFLDLMRHLQVNLPGGFRIQPTQNWELGDHQFDPGVMANDNDDDVMFTVNQVYVQRHIPMDYRFHRLVQRYYQTPIRSLDFVYAAEESWHHINAKVKHETQGRIDRILDDSNLETSGGNGHHPLSSTRLLFLSGLHFRARLDFRHLVNPFITHHNGGQRRRRRRGALQRLWPLRSPFLPTAAATHPHHHPILLPGLVHSNHHRPPPLNRPPPFGLLFKPWLVNNNQTFTPYQTPSITTTTTTATTTTMSTTTSSTASPVIDSRLSSTTSATPIIVSKPNSNHFEHAAFNPFEPYRPLLTPNDNNDHRIAHKQRIRLRYQHNDYLNSTVIELPFVGGTVSMLILLPDSVQQMSLMLARLNGQLIIDLLQTLETKRLDISLPLFTNHSHSIDPDRFDKLLTSIGFGELFATTTADHSTITNSMEQNAFAALVPQMRIYHKCMIDMDVIDDHHELNNWIGRSSRSTLQEYQIQSSVLHFVDDHNGDERKQKTQPPHQDMKHVSLEEKTFLYLIIDNISGLILMVGKHEATVSAKNMQ